MYVSETAKDEMPKKAQNGYMRYRADVYEELKKKNEDKSMTELTQLISQMWNGLDEKKKEKYQKEYEKTKAKYDEDYAAWLKKFKLDEKKVKEFFKDEKQNKKRGKRSKLVKQDSDDDDEVVEKAKQKKQMKGTKNKSPAVKRGKK